jgi:hypothetical protein
VEAEVPRLALLVVLAEQVAEEMENLLTEITQLLELQILVEAAVVRLN